MHREVRCQVTWTESTSTEEGVSTTRNSNVMGLDLDDNGHSESELKAIVSRAVAEEKWFWVFGTGRVTGRTLPVEHFMPDDFQLLKIVRPFDDAVIYSVDLGVTDALSVSTKPPMVVATAAPAGSGNPRTDSPESNPTLSDIGKKQPKKKRRHNKHSLECMKLHTKALKIDPSESMESVVKEYANDHRGVRGAAKSTIIRILNDHSEEWNSSDIHPT